MGDIRTDGVGGGLYPPGENKPSSDSPIDFDVQIPQADDKGKRADNTNQGNQLSGVRYKIHPDVVAAFGIGIENFEYLIRFIEEEAEEVSLSGKTREEIYQELFNIDDSFAESIRTELIPQFSLAALQGIELEFAEMLRKRLAVIDHSVHDNMPESVTLVRMLVSLHGADDFLSRFAMPYLRKDPGLKHPGVNYDFCMRLLKSQDRDTQNILLHSLDYTSVIKSDDFAESLLRFAEPVDILNALHDSSRTISEEDEGFEFQAEGQTPDMPQNINNKSERSSTPLMISISVLTRLGQSLRLSSEYAEQIRELYSLASNQHIQHHASEFLVNYDSHSADIFERDFTNIKEEDEQGSQNEYERDYEKKYEKNYKNDFDRFKRFYSIGYYAWANKKYATVEESIPTLVQFIKTEEDSYLVSKACYMLAEHCGEKGNDALAEVIINQIKNNETSLPLAELTMLLTNFKSEPYFKVFRKVLSADYKEGVDLGEAYRKLSDVMLHAPLTGEKEWLDEPASERPKLLFNLFKEVGLITMLKLPSDVNGFSVHNDTKENTQRKNLISLLKSLSDDDFSELRNLVTEAKFVNRDPKDLRSLHRLNDKTQIDTNRM